MAAAQKERPKPTGLTDSEKFKQIIVQQWFSTGGGNSMSGVALRELLAMSGDTFDCYNWRRVLLTSRR
jgi:hypothetical protein